MPPSPSQPSDRDPLRTLLDDAESELRQRLEDACEAEAKGVSTESTEEVRQLEDNLLAAALAAKQTVALRGQMKSREHAEREPPIRLKVAADRSTQAGAPRTGRPGPKADKPAENVVMGVREFTDDQGRPWRAWSVVPGLSRASMSGGRFLGDFQNGWICFESLGNTGRRRLPYPRSKWSTISDEELRQLLQNAIDAPIREKKSGGAGLIPRSRPA
jgi:hypothetical protein